MPTEFRLCTWNVWFDSLLQGARINAIVQELLSIAPDIICLQEVTEPILALIRQLIVGSPYVVFSDEESTRQYGQIALVNSQRINVALILYGSVPFPDSRMGRRICCLTCTIGAKRFTILNVHLESEFSANPNGTKANQLRYLLNFARSNAINFGTVIVCGDCNWSPQDDGWAKRTLGEFAFRDVGLPTLSYDYMANSNIRGNFRSRLDRVLLPTEASLNSKQIQQIGTKPIRSLNIFPSDHFGIAMKFWF